MYGTGLRSVIDTMAGTNREKWVSSRDGTREGAVNPTQVPDGPTEKWQEPENNMQQAKGSYKEFHDRRTASTRNVSPFRNTYAFQNAFDSHV